MVNVHFTKVVKVMIMITIMRIVMKIMISSSQKQPPEVICKKGVLRNFTIFTGKHLYQGLFFNKVAGLLKNSFFIEHLSWLLLTAADHYFHYDSHDRYHYHHFHYFHFVFFQKKLNSHFPTLL